MAPQWVPPRRDRDILLSGVAANGKSLAVRAQLRRVGLFPSGCSTDTWETLQVTHGEA